MGRAKSLSEVHRSVSIPSGASLYRRIFAFLGPAYLISVGYMDPGNWATDLEAGSRFGYKLLWVILMSNIMAVLMQTLAARLGIVTGRDLAQACRDHYPRSVNYMLWVLAEVAIAACDLAEVLGTAIGLNLLLGIPLLWGVLITVADTFLFLAVQKLGFRRFEGFVLFLITIIGGCFVYQVLISGADWSKVAQGFVPSLPDGSLYIAIGIIGATVMPHNLYLHSALVQTRAFDLSPEGKRLSCRFNLLDSVLALNAAFFVNSAILIVSSAVFFEHGIIVTELQQAHKLLSPILGTSLAGLAFALALLASGQASTLTGTLAGQIVMEGYLHFKMRLSLRRLLTRLLAVIPAALTIGLAGEQFTYSLLILSQVILSLQLPFAVIPLIHFTSDRSIMSEFANRGWTKVLGWTACAIIVALNCNLVMDHVGDWITAVSEPSWIYATIIPFLTALALLLLYVTIKPFVRWPPKETIPAWTKLSHFIRGREDDLQLDVPHYKKVGVAVAFNNDDKKVLSHAVPFAHQYDSMLCLFHVVEGPGGTVFGPEAYDSEAREDEEYLDKLATALGYKGVDVETTLGFGDVPRELIRLAKEHELDILFMGGHGHKALRGIFYGSTISSVRQELDIPVVIVR